MNNLSYLIKQGIRSVWKNRFMSFASLCIMTVSLILVGMSAIVMLDCGIILDNVSDKNEISVYLNDDADIKHIGEVLKSNTLTEKVDFVSAEEGLKKMIEQYSEQKELFENLPYNPVPATYMVTINDLDKISTAVQQFKAIDGVYKVNAPMDFAGFIKDLRTTFTIIGIVLIVALGTVSVIIISNTTRLSVFSRRKEIAIMRIVGATNSFIKTPFFVEGLFIGLLSGLLSWFVTICLRRTSECGMRSEWATYCSSRKSAGMYWRLAAVRAHCSELSARYSAQANTLRYNGERI